MKLGEQWEIEMPGFGKMTVSSQTNTNKQTDRQADKWSHHKQIQTKKQTNRWSVLKEMQTIRQTSGQMVTSQTDTNKQTDRQTNGQSSKKCKQMVSSKTNTNLGKPKRRFQD